MTADDLRRLWRRKLDAEAIAEAERHEAHGRRVLAYMVRRGLLRRACIRPAGSA